MEPLVQKRYYYYSGKSQLLSLGRQAETGIGLPFLLPHPRRLRCLDAFFLRQKSPFLFKGFGLHSPVVAT